MLELLKKSWTMRVQPGLLCLMVRPSYLFLCLMVRPSVLIFVLKKVSNNQGSCFAWPLEKSLEQWGCNLCSALWFIILIFALEKCQTTRMALLLWIILHPLNQRFDAWVLEQLGWSVLRYDICSSNLKTLKKSLNNEGGLPYG